MIKPGDVVYSKSMGYPFKVTAVMLAKDYPDDPEATEDLISVVKDRTFPGYSKLERWEKDYSAMWPVDWVTTSKQLELNFDSFGCG